MQTFVDESGSMPSVFGELIGAKIVRCWTSTWLQYTGWIFQNGEFIKVRLEITTLVEYISSTRGGLV